MSDKISENVRIVVLRFGWVFVGRLEQYNEEGINGFILRNAYCIRKWGTTEGLGQLSYQGPTEETKLDRGEDLVFDKESMIFMIKCIEGKWENHIGILDKVAKAA